MAVLLAGMPTCTASGNVLAETAFGVAPANTVRAALTMPSWVQNSHIDGRELVLRCGILVTTAGAFTYGPSIRLYSGGNTGLTTFTNDTAIVTPAAPTISTATRMLSIEARVTWDPSTARLQGRYTWMVDTTLTNWVTLTAGLTAGVTNASNLNWCLTGIFGTTGVNTAVLKYFEMELV